MKGVRNLSNVMLLLLALVQGSAAAHAAMALSAWEWQRVVLPASPVQEQCVVLDGELYHRAAPGLQDLRLVQAGRDVAYALEESHDAAYDLHPEGGAERDRSVYTTVLQISLRSIAGAGPVETGSGVLPARVPVERILFVPEKAPSTTTARGGDLAQFRLAAVPSNMATQHGGKRPEGELIEGKLRDAETAVLTAIGANLQNDATVSVSVQPDTGGVSRVLLQMRERLLCFQPLSSKPMLLLFGNSSARPLRYDYAQHYHPVSAPLLAKLGPVERNPKFHARRPRRELLRTPRTRIALAALLCIAALLLLAPFFSVRRR